MDAYRSLFWTALDQVAIDDIRLAFNQNKPLGDSRFYAKIERILGERRQAKPRGRPKRAAASSSEAEEIQDLLKLE
jgi:putative transposase